MSPWLRLLRVVLLRDRRRVDVLATTRVRLRVWPNDLDFNRHVNNGRYLSLADLGRIDWFLRTGLLQLALRQGAFPVVGDAIAKFRRDLRVFQSFEICSRIVGWDERWGFLEHRFLRGGRVVAVVAVRGMFRGANGPVPPSAFLVALGAPRESPPLPEWLRSWSGASEGLSAVLRAEEVTEPASNLSE
jgi:acyl-CoA thioesterase FadM